MSALRPAKQRIEPVLEAGTLERIAALVTTQGLDDAKLRDLRAAWPELRFTRCSDDDICAQSPYLLAEGFNLYLIDASEHCPVLTNDPAAASGVVLADVADDEH